MTGEFSKTAEDRLRTLYNKIRGRTVRDILKIFPALLKMNFKLDEIRDRELKRDFIREVFFQDTDMERFSVWVQKITGDWESLFPVDGPEESVSFEELFKKVFTMDVNRNKLAPASGTKGKDSADKRVLSMYKNLGMALHYLRIRNPEVFERTVPRLNKNLKKLFMDYYRKNASQFERKWEVCHKNWPVKRNWHCEGLDITDLLLASTPSSGSFSKEKVAESFSMSISSESQFKNTPDMWSLACECAENGAIPEKYTENYDVLNCPGLRTPWFLNAPRTTWHSFRFGGGVGAEGVTAARLLAENIQYIKENGNSIPDSTLFMSHYLDGHIPPIAFTAYAAREIMDDDMGSFEKFMREYMLDRISRFGPFYEDWKKTDFFKGLKEREARAVYEVDVDNATRYCLKFVAYPLVSMPGAPEQTRGDIYSFLVENEELKEEYFDALTRWTSSRLASLIIHTTGWFPFDVKILENHREWIEALFDEEYRAENNPRRLIPEFSRRTYPMAGTREKALLFAIDHPELLMPCGEPSVVRDEEDNETGIRIYDGIIEKTAKFFSMCSEIEGMRGEPNCCSDRRVDFLHNVIVRILEEMEGYGVSAQDIIRAMRKQYLEYFDRPECVISSYRHSDEQQDDMAVFFLGAVWGKPWHEDLFGKEYINGMIRASKEEYFDSAGKIALRKTEGSVTGFFDSENGTVGDDDFAEIVFPEMM